MKGDFDFASAFFGMFILSLINALSMQLGMVSVQQQLGAALLYFGLSLFALRRGA